MRRLLLRFRSVLMRSRLEREMRDEMSSHIEQATARNIARGMLPDDAARAAHREFGNVPYLQEQARDARGMRWIDAVKADVRFALRQFRRARLSTVTMVLVLALGIGANVALFTVSHSLWTNPGPGLQRDEARVRIRGIAFFTWSDRGAAPLLPLLRTTAATAVPHVPMQYMETVYGLRERGSRDRMRGFAGIGAGGVIALFLAAIGLYAIVAFAVGQRTREIGIRTALGAQRREMIGLFFGAGIRLSLLGLIFGLPLSLIALRIIAQQTGLPAVSTAFIATAVALGVLVVAGIATWVPARRAATVDPLTALRSE